MADDKSSKSRVAIVAVVLAVIIAIGLLIWWCGSRKPAGDADNTKERGGRVATILAVNDIYRIDGVGEKQIGGLHRLRTLRKTVEKEAGKVLLLHAGDFLSPSLESRVFKGEQMIDAMNNLDGDPKKFDARMFVTFGNHEFDDSNCLSTPAPLNARIDESQFTWLNANLDFPNCASMKDVMAHKNVKRTAIVDLGGIKFGLFGIGLTYDPRDPKRYPKFGDIYESARAAIKELRAKKVDVVVALTHLERQDDEMLVRSLADYGLDLLIGGHDHAHMTIEDTSGKKRGFKADSDAKTAWRIEVRIPQKGKVEFRESLVPLDGNKPETAADETIEKLAKKWTAQAEAKFCALRKQANREPNGDKCLQQLAGSTQFDIKLEEADNRETETDFGKWIAGIVREKTNADVAIVNAGILGLNTNLDKGSKLLYQQVVDIFRYDDVVAVRKASPKAVCAAIRHGFGKPGTGGWPHVSGVSAEGDSSSPKAVLEKWKGVIKRSNGAPLDCADDKPTLTVASVPYLLCGGDEYQPMVDDNEKSPTCMDALKRNPMKEPGAPAAQFISSMAEDAFRAAGTAGIKLP